MVGIGMIMILAGLTGVWLWWRGRLFDARWYLWPAQHAWWMGFVAVISGWIVTETGRQPWVAYGVLRTAEAASPLAANTVATTSYCSCWSTASCSQSVFITSTA